MKRYKRLFEQEDMIVKSEEEEVNKPEMELKQQTQDAVVENPMVEEDDEEINFEDEGDFIELENEEEEEEFNFEDDEELPELEDEEEFDFNDEEIQEPKEETIVQ